MIGFLGLRGTKWNREEKDDVYCERVAVRNSKNLGMGMEGGR